MNSLSWLLYIGNVAGNLGSVLWIAGIILVLVAIITYMVDRVERSELVEHLKYRGRDEDVKKLVDRKSYPSYAFLVVGIIAWFLAALSPSSDTVYAIAASQLGEQAMKTPIAAKAGEAVEAWLDKQIAANKPDTKKSD